jgi:hypothetical protein
MSSFKGEKANGRLDQESRHCSVLANDPVGTTCGSIHAISVSGHAPREPVLLGLCDSHPQTYGRNLVKQILLPIILLAFAAQFGFASAIADKVDAGSYMQKQGWTRVDVKSLPRSLVPDVLPLMFYDKGNSVPSCGLLTASGSGKQPVFIELVGCDVGVGFPQCLAIVAITAFKLQNKEYMAIEYLSRETREDVDRRFHYLVRDAAKSFVTDSVLTDAAPVLSEGQGAARTVPTKSHDGVRFARLFQLGKAQPAWRLLERDFISDKSSSFATFQNKPATKCQFVTEAGGAPVVTSYDAFAPSTKCDSVLASSRVEKAGKVYYLDMFKTQDKKQLMGITSVAPDGRIKVENTLAESINLSGMTKDMKAAKAALMKEIQ